LENASFWKTLPEPKIPHQIQFSKPYAILAVLIIFPNIFDFACSEHAQYLLMV